MGVTQGEQGHAGSAVTGYVGGNMEHGMLYYSRKIVVFSRNKVLFTLSNTAAVVVVYATCYVL